MQWPWSRRAEAPAAPAVDVEAVVNAAVERVAEKVQTTAIAAARETARALISESPMLGAPLPQVENSKPALYAFDRPIYYSTPQAPTRHPDSLISVDMLRRLADTYDVLRSCIQHLKREVLSIPIAITARDDSDTSEGTKTRIKEASQFFAALGGIGGAGKERAVFEGMVLEDVLVIGAAAVFYQRSRGGGLLEALAVDAATIRPCVDAYGWPGPGEKAYEQWVYGVQVASFTREQLRYAGLPTCARSWTPYFASPVEYLIHVVNSALRADHWNRAWLTDGNTPSDMIALPEEWTPEQIQAWAAYWDNMLAGSTADRQKTKFVPGGSERVGNPTRKDQEFSVFELWLLRRTCAIMGVQPASIGFVGEQYKVTQGESMDATTQFGAGPLLDYRKALYDEMLELLGYSDLECQNAQDADPKKAAEVGEIQIRSGQRTPNELRKADGLDPMEGGDTLFISNTLQPVERAANPPDPAPQPDPKQPAPAGDDDPGAE